MIVIGLDGLDPRIVESLLEAGELPHLASLRRSGAYSRVATTTPAQTPVAWSTFATGVNPGGHGIFDFLRRDAKTYLPDHALYHYEQKNPFVPPRAVNRRRAEGIWSFLSKAGVASKVLRHPCLYPCEQAEGHLLAGVGVPDLRGGFGTATFYTTKQGVEAQRGESVIALEPAVAGKTQTHLLGPRGPKDPGGVRVPLTIERNRTDNKLVLKSQGDPCELVVDLGRWSDWLRVKFPMGMFQNLRGMLRFHLAGLEPEIELYASPVNFDPAAPPFPISHPTGFAGELADQIGLYHTLGMAEDHSALGNGRINEHAFLDQCDSIWRERDAMFAHELEATDRGLVFCLYDTPDRVQHMFWRFREQGHPALLGKPAGGEFARVVEETYRRADLSVGKALEFADDQTLVVALSDHGFTSFQRGFHANAWLRDQGLLAVRPDAQAGGDLLRSVDWDRTKAYAVGLGGVYLNIKGREARGIVSPDEAPGLKESIAAALGGFVDPLRSARAIHQVRMRENVYSGPFVAEAPDLLIDFAPGYRISWSSSIGSVAGETFEDNHEAWSGDHIVDPLTVPGVLFMNQKFATAGARLLDLAPTILSALGVPVPQAMEGKTLWD